MLRYITYVMLYNICYIAYVMLCYIAYAMLCYITCYAMLLLRSDRSDICYVM